MMLPVLSGVAGHKFSQALRFDPGAPVDLPEAPPSAPRLLYLHVPFCENLCPYCSFNRVLFQEAQCRRYFAALRREMHLYRERGYDFVATYVGGGTPTILGDELAETLHLATSLFSVREISVETNPNHLTPEKMAVLEAAGVNRLSVGVQSFDDALLRTMKRYEAYGSGDEVARRLAAARGRFDTLNADLIFGFPTQTVDILLRDLDRLDDLGVDQITCYPLMASRRTRADLIRTVGRWDERREETFYRAIRERLAPRFRLSSAWCFSRQEGPIDEYIVDYDEYAGLGSGAFGYVNGVCYANTFDIDAYIAALDGGRLPLMASRTFSSRDRLRYAFLMNLFGGRLDLTALRTKFGRWGLGILWPEMTVFRLAGLVRREGDELRLTERGQYAWVVMMREFFTAVNNFREDCRQRVAAAALREASETGGGA